MLLLRVAHLLELDIYVISVYRPPSSSSADDASLMAFFSSFCTDKEFVLMGDLNLPSIRWAGGESWDAMVPTDRTFYDCFAALGVTQVVRESTMYPSGNILDLVLLSHEERLGDCVVHAQ